MLESGLWTRRRKWRPRFRRRDRREHFGELVQLDGSFHDWLEGRGPVGCLMTMTDDATGRVFAQISKEETIWSAGSVLRGWIDLYGCPRALYTDRKNLYHSRSENGPLSQLGLMCQKLSIEMIAANSPQAKGRVERTHGTKPGPADQEAALEGDFELRGDEPLPERGISPSPQRPICSRSLEQYRLSSADESPAQGSRSLVS